MSVRIIPFESAHVMALPNLGGQEQVVGEIDRRDLAELSRYGDCYTAIRGDAVIGCAGLAAQNKYRAMAWALFARTSPRDFIAIHLAARRVLATSGFLRIETFVDPNFAAGVRWIKQLGFTMERAYVPYIFADGSGASQWALYPHGR